MCVRKGGKVGGGELEVGVCTMYCGYDDTLKMKVPWEEDYYFWRKLTPVSDCAWKECVVFVVSAAAEMLVLQAVWWL